MSFEISCEIHAAARKSSFGARHRTIIFSLAIVFLDLLTLFGMVTQPVSSYSFRIWLAALLEHFRCSAINDFPFSFTTSALRDLSTFCRFAMLENDIVMINILYLNPNF